MYNFKKVSEKGRRIDRYKIQDTRCKTQDTQDTLRINTDYREINTDYRGMNTGAGCKIQDAGDKEEHQCTGAPGTREAGCKMQELRINTDTSVFIGVKKLRINTDYRGMNTDAGCKIQDTRGRMQDTGYIKD